MNVPTQIVWAVVNSVWQSAIVALVAWAALRCARNTTAALRYAVWSAVLASSALLAEADFAWPAATKTLPSNSVSTFIDDHRSLDVRVPAATQYALTLHSATSVVTQTVAAHPTKTSDPSAFDRVRSDAPAIASAISRWIRAFSPAVVWLWVLVVAGLLARLGAGYGRLRHIKRGLRRLHGVEFGSAAEPAVRSVTIGASDDVDCPCLIGYVHPAIALPTGLVCDLHGADLERVLRHEIAHARRFDDWANLIQQVLRAVLFVNPIVHIACRRLDVEREIACDDLAAAGASDRLEYARCLTEIARRTSYSGRFAPAPGFFPDRKQIIVRIEQLLDRNHNASSRVGAASVISAAALLIAGVALAKFQVPAFADSVAPVPVVAPAASRSTPIIAVKVVAPARLPARIAPAVAPIAAVHHAVDANGPVRVVVSRARVAAMRHAVAALQPVPVVISLARVAALQHAVIAMSSAQVLAPAPRAPAAPHPAGESDLGAYLDALSSAGYTRLSVDELIAVRNAGITLSFLRSLKQNGIAPMSVEKLVALANSGVDAVYIASMGSAGFGKVSVDELISLRNAGVDPGFARSIAESLRTHPSLDTLVSLANAGVNAAYVAKMAKAGFAGLSVESLISMANAGVSPEYVAGMSIAGFSNASVDTLVSMANAGVSVAYVRSLAGVGYSHLSSDDLIRMANAGVSAKLVKSLRAHGIGNNGALSVDELIRLANSGF